MDSESNVDIESEQFNCEDNSMIINETTSIAPVIINETTSIAPVIINETTSIAPVIIEELDATAISSMNVDINEFVEAKALKVQNMNDAIMADYEYSPHCTSAMDNIADPDDQDDSLAPEEDDKLTKQFLNGELTFSEYSIRMDRGVIDHDLEITETHSSRKDTESEDTGTQKTNTKKSQRPAQYKQRKKRRNLPPVLQGLMGEANLRFAKGETELAAQICMEIIRQVPSAPDPFQTLAMIYENDQPEKSLQFALIAAHLSPKDADQWVRLANLSQESGNIKQAITCYTKAIQGSPKDVKLYEDRARLQEQNGDKRAYLKAYAKLLHQFETEDGESIVKYGKMLAKRYMQENNYEQALEAMENIFTKCEDLITLEEVNVMTELLIALKQFTRCLNTLTKYTNIWVRYKTPAGSINTDDERKSTPDSDPTSLSKNQTEATDNSKIEACDIPDDVVVDLKAKFLVTLIELNEVKMADQLLPKLYMKENPEISGDLFLDVAEALMERKEFGRALALLDPLVNSKNFSLAAVWLRHAECWEGCGDYNKAIASYEVVSKLSPQHLGARLALAKLYKIKSQYEKAINVLDQDPDMDALDPSVIYERTLLLLKVKKYDEYFRSGMLLLSRHCITIRNKLELNALTRATSIRQRLQILSQDRLSCGEKISDDNVPTFIDSAHPDEKSEFSMFVQMCKIACKMKKYGLLQRLCFSALTSQKFAKRNSHITFLCLLSCIYNNDSFYGYNIVRELVRVCRTPHAWNLLNIIIQKAEDSRHNRFLLRLLGREDAFSYLHIMHANNCLVSGTYKYALNDYVSLFRVAPSALLALLIAVTMLQMGCQKMSAKKNHLVIQAMAFLKKYSELRGKGAGQEVNYNMARAFHQLSLLPGAVFFYKKVLDIEPDDIIQANPKLLDLRQEAAFNLHLIYLHSDNHLLARMYLENYITV